VAEGCPVDPDSPSYRFMGFVPVFAEAGFQEVALAGSRRGGGCLWCEPASGTHAVN
jgi:hypothetical protein